VGVIGYHVGRTASGDVLNTDALLLRDEAQDGEDDEPREKARAAVHERHDQRVPGDSRPTWHQLWV